MFSARTFDKQLMDSASHALEVHHYLGGNMGVMKGCDVTENVDGNLEISAGAFIVMGRQIEVISTEVITVPVVPSGTLYSILIFEIDLSQTNTDTEFLQGSFKIVSSSTSYPTLTQQDLNDGGAIYQFEFARFENTVSGIGSLTDTRTQLEMSVYAKDYTYTATIPYTSWTGSSAPYSKAVTVTGILSTDKPIIDLVLTGTYATDQTMRTNWAKIYRGVTSTDTITFYADTVPTADISIQLVVVR